MKSDAWLTYLDEFMNEYYKELPKHKTYREAYEEILRTMKDEFKPRLRLAITTPS
jgi:hypothetical protein